MFLGLALALGTAGMTLSAELSGNYWRPNFLSASALPPGHHMVVHFDPDGTISGNGGCNQFTGAYTASGNQIQIGPITSTRKGCPEFLIAETAFFATLRAAKSYTQEGDTLALYDATGRKLVQFSRD